METIEPRGAPTGNTNAQKGTAPADANIHIRCTLAVKNKLVRAATRKQDRTLSEFIFEACDAQINREKKPS